MKDQVTQLLLSIQEGDSHAADQLLPIVYEELRQLARIKAVIAWLEAQLEGLGLGL